MYFESESDAINFTANISAGLIEVPSLLSLRDHLVLDRKSSKTCPASSTSESLPFDTSSQLCCWNWKFRWGQTSFPSISSLFLTSIRRKKMTQHHPTAMEQWRVVVRLTLFESWVWDQTTHEGNLWHCFKKLMSRWERHFLMPTNPMMQISLVPWMPRSCNLFFNGATLCLSCIDCCCSWKRSNLTYWTTWTDTCFHDSPPKGFSNCGNCLLPSLSKIGGSYCSCNGCSNIST